MSSDNIESSEIRKMLIALGDTAAFERATPSNDNGQPAPDAQTRTIEETLGKSLFREMRDGTELSKIGRHLLGRAREILADNDRRLQSIAAPDHDEPIRIGISSMLLDFLVDHPANASLSNATVRADICSKIVSAFDDEDVDVAMVMDVRDHRATLGGDIVAEFDIEFAWMQADEFVVDAAAPIPLATWPPDQHIVLNSLSEVGRPYKVMFTGPDYSAKLTAVRSGHCLAVVPRHAIAPPFMAADDDHLPVIPPKKILLAVRGDPASERFRAIVDAMSSFQLAGTPGERRQ